MTGTAKELNIYLIKFLIFKHINYELICVNTDNVDNVAIDKTNDLYTNLFQKKVINLNN